MKIIYIFIFILETDDVIMDISKTRLGMRQGSHFCPIVMAPVISLPGTLPPGSQPVT